MILKYATANKHHQSQITVDMCKVSMYSTYITLRPSICDSIQFVITLSERVKKFLLHKVEFIAVRNIMQK